MKLVTSILRLLGRPLPNATTPDAETAERVAVTRHLDRQEARLRVLDAQNDAQLGQRAK